MANNSTDIRRLMSLVESVQEPALLEGWLTNLKNKRVKRLGDRERAEMADRLKKEWLKWLGQTGRDGTDEDMERFMRVRIGFKDQDIQVVMDKVFDTEPTSTDRPSSDDEEPAKANAPAKPKAVPAPEVDPEDGIPLPTDLNTKLSDFGKVGIDVEVDDNKKEPGEIVDDPKKYFKPDGLWDRKKISDKLSKMPIGDKLTLGKSSFSRSVGEPQNAPTDKTASESITEATVDSDVLDNETVDDLMDASAAHINDEYLLNGPVNDTNDAIADMAAQRAASSSSNRRSNSKRDDSNSGPYDAQSMNNILKNELEIGDAKLRQITQYVKDNAGKGYGRMQPSDIDVLARIGYALLRTRT